MKITRITKNWRGTPPRRTITVPSSPPRPFRGGRTDRLKNVDHKKPWKDKCGQAMTGSVGCSVRWGQEWVVLRRRVCRKHLWTKRHHVGWWRHAKRGVFHWTTHRRWIVAGWTRNPQFFLSANVTISRVVDEVVRPTFAVKRPGNWHKKTVSYVLQSILAECSLSCSARDVFNNWKTFSA